MLSVIVSASALVMTREISPLDSSGREVGGQSMTVFTLEVSHPIWNFLRGAAFVDAGGVSKSEYKFGFDHFNIGAGYGLRIKLPNVPMPTCPSCWIRRSSA